MEGVWWAIGALFALTLTVIGLLFQIKESLRAISEKADKQCKELTDRVSKIEATVEPLKEITMEAVPKMLKLHHSGDVLEEAFCGPPDESRISVAEQMVQEEWDKPDNSPGRLLALTLAKWLLKVRREELERDKRKGACT